MVEERARDLADELYAFLLESGDLDERTLQIAVAAVTTFGDWADALSPIFGRAPPLQRHERESVHQDMTQDLPANMPIGASG